MPEFLVFPVPEAMKEEQTRILEIAALGALFVFYFLLKAATLRITTADEGVYYYAAHLWLSGFVPYRDFFLSHPPLHLLEAALALKLFGTNFLLLNAIPSVLLSSVSGWLTFRIARRELGFTAGWCASFLFLFSLNQLLQSNHMTGANLSLVLLLAGLDTYLGASSSAVRKRRVVAAGALCGAGMMAGAYVLPGFLLLCLVALLREPGDLRPLLAGFALIAVPVHLLFFVYGGPAFIDDVYLYHLRKVPQSAYFADAVFTIVKFVQEERQLALLTLLGLHVHLAAREPLAQRWSISPSSLATLSLLFGVDYLLFFVYQHSVFRHYLLFILPFAAIVAAYGLLPLLHMQLPRLRPSLRSCLQGGIALCIAGFLVWNIFSSIALYTRFAFATPFAGAHDIAIYTKKVLEPGETIYGDFGIVPTVALLSGIRIAAREIESSVMRYESGFSSVTDLIRALEADHIGAVISRKGTDVWLSPDLKKYIETYYVREAEFPEATGTVEFWRRKRGVVFEG